MKLIEFADQVLEGRMVWRKMGKNVKRAVRCTSGPRRGRVVATVSQCAKPINIKKRLTLKKNKSKNG